MAWLRAEQPLVVAHRGQRVSVPELTMASFEAAIERGAEMIEADAQLTRDGQLVLMHDTTIDRTTDGRGRVADLAWAEISRLDAGGPFDQAFAGLRVPRAEDLIELARVARIGLCIEAKGATTQEMTRVAVELAHLVRERDAINWAFVSSFDHAALAAARAVVPEILLAPERLPERGNQSAQEVLRQALALGAPVMQHRWELITADVVELLHKAGVAVWAWNTNDDASLRATLAFPVDGVIGDDVSVLIAGRAAAGRVTGGRQATWIDTA